MFWSREKEIDGPRKRWKRSTYMLLVHVGVFIGTEIDVKVLGLSFPDTQKKNP